MIHISNRILRKTLFLMLAVIGTSSVSAQYYLNLYQKDGSNIKYKTSEIEKISITDRMRPNFNAEFVDLGLSVKWASCNLGAMTPTEFGMYYAWGETDTIVSSSQYKWYDNITQKYSKYVLTEYYGKMDNKYRLDAEDDVANVYGGPDWRIPTDKEVQELVDSCYWIWTYVNGVAGYQVRSPKNGNSIFLPAAGVVWDSIPQSQGYSGYYLTNTLYTQYNSSLCNSLYFYEMGLYLTNDNRNFGYTVRPVVSSKFDDNLVVATSLTINKKSISVEAGQQDSINAVYRLEKPELGVQLSWVSSNPAIAKVSSNGIVVGISAGKCEITAKIGSLTESCAVTVTASTAVKEAVDMGLSVRWATCNIGASKEEYVGSYYAWGETSGKTTYTWDNYKWVNKESIIYKYNDDDNLTTLQPDDDAAHVIWGDDWRMPTNAEFRELVTNCDITNDKKDGMPVVKFTSRINGGVIYFPLNGEFEGESWSSSPIGYVWTSNRNEDEVQQALSAFMLSLQFAGIINVSPNESENQFSTRRYVGLGIRPVKPYSVADIDSLMLDETEVELLVNKNYELVIKGRIPGSGAVAVSGVQWSSSDDKVATVKDGVITAIGKGTCVITAAANNLTAECTVTVVDGSPEYVDLGLSVMWASFNVGAYKPEMAGDYYAWGELEPKENYSWETYKYCNGSDTTLTKYCVDSKLGDNGFIDNKSVLDPEDDVAHVLWGGKWRIPTKQEFQELIDSCVWNRNDSLNGVKGISITGPNGNSIFLPSYGYYDGETYKNPYGGEYATSNLNSSNSRIAYVTDYEVWSMNRCLGVMVRPVYGNDVSDIHAIKFAREELRLALDSESDLEINLLNESGRVIYINTPIDINYVSDNVNVATVTEGKVKAVGVGTCTITASYGNKTDICSVTVEDLSLVEPESVDLGLSVKWATFNVGAFSPEMAGDYYSWGELEPKTNYSWATYKYSHGSDTSLTKYCNDSYYGYCGFVDYKLVLDQEDDVAHVLWGENWRTPAMEEFEELVGKCSWEWIELDGVYGFKITSRVIGYTDKSIFIPSVGYYNGTELGYVSQNGVYMSNELRDYNCYQNLVYYSDQSKAYVTYGGSRCLGMPVRPVYTFDISAIDSIGLKNDTLQCEVGSGYYPLIVKLFDESGRSIHVNSSLDINWTSDDLSVATVEDGMVLPVGEGSCIITASYDSYNAVCVVNVTDPSKVMPESVDLGLSVKWATFNIGAYKPEMTGDYFAWGETEPYYEDGYANSDSPVWKTGKEQGYYWQSYFDTNDGGSTFIKYNETNGITVLEPEDDAASVNWGDGWRIPTYYELQELVDSCTWTKTEYKGVSGYMITSNVSGYENNSIFLPYTGFRSGKDYNEVDNCAYYWSSTIDLSEQTVKDLCLENGGYTFYDDYRHYGQSYRPVQLYDDTYIESLILNLYEDELYIDDVIELTVHGVYPDGHVIALGGQINWITSDEDVAVVVNGKVTAVGAGTVTITAEYKGLTKICSITVIDPNE